MKAVNKLFFILLLSTIACDQSREKNDTETSKPEETETKQESPRDDADLIMDVEDIVPILEPGLSPEGLEEAKDEAAAQIEEEAERAPLKAFVLEFEHSQLCLSFESANNRTANIWQERCVAGAAKQQFQLIPSDVEGYFYMRNVASGLCLSPVTKSVARGVNIGQGDCILSDAQKFASIEQSDGFIILKNYFSELCLDNTLANIFSPNNVIQWTCHGKSNQRFKLEQIDLEQGTASSSL